MEKFTKGISAVKKIISYSFKRSLPVMYGYLFLGMTFGIMLRNVGYGVFWAAISSLFVYAGSGQFLMCEFIADNASLITCALMTFLLNSRHIFYGLSFIVHFKKLGRLKWVPILELTDETYSVLCFTIKDSVNPLCYLFISVFDHLYWIIGSVIGNLIGALPFDFTGVDFSMTALFVVLFVDQWRSSGYKLPAICGFVTSIVSVVIFRLFFDVNNFIFPALMVSSVVLLLTRDIYEKKTAQEVSAND